MNGGESPTTRSDTETNTPSRVSTTGGPTPFLVLALESEQPLSPSLRFSLQSLHEVRVGRAAERGDTRREEAHRNILELRIPDPRLSSRHARLVRELGRWVLEDEGSKNGVLVNGVQQRRAVLSHGDLIEVGHSFLLYVERPSVAPTPLRTAAAERPPLADGLETFVPQMEAGLAALAHVAPSRVPVMLLGETGTGKEITAHAVHALSGRTGPLVAINCGALPQALVESELFGHRKGAFTGAHEDRPGLVRSAAGGTLFLDEVGDLPLPLQAALLRVLQEGEVLPVGSAQPVKVDVRVVAATHRDLDALVEQGLFRSDLLARLCGLTVRLLPLRDRREDLGLLIGGLLRKVAAAHPQVAFTREAARALLSYRWPLNVRELEKSLSVASVLAGAGKIELSHLPEQIRAARPLPPEPVVAPPPSVPSRELTPPEQERKAQLLELLRRHQGNVSAIARELDLARMQIQRWLKRYGLDPEKFRG
ncbi:MAG: sigma 54-interacting transcriptional regulator [Myxococcota bacterium]|nr:sigma 54-interacting transcriptional regulator [Myxococcota bacterium]